MADLALATSSARTVISSSLCSIVFCFWDIVITFDDEVENIWGQPSHSITKWLFLFTRYFALAVQILLVMKSSGVFRPLPLPERLCPYWLIFQSLAARALSSSVLLILMLRVYVLYDCTRAIRSGLLALFAVFIVPIVPIHVLLARRIQFTPTCTPAKTPPGVLFVQFFKQCSWSSRLSDVERLRGDGYRL
ncbi:hypothetical protein JAAARDRAFT_478089 [Jaapia argillacea MUCL 33604]|uniref:DUF6533 domain-containing protein n=1 Tax=Jaapia argillacea MUCL 33604 TaxID=933084 RepID=A0A067PCP3_9AGAM|nr:hypothetical protein JAAARDRAFT_478089 [Jaapia argillacea MUCL 33604]